VISWIALYPELYKQEVAEVAKSYPHLSLCATAREAGELAYHGELVIRGSGGTRRHKILLNYPDTFPYRMPYVVPLLSLPEREPHSDVQPEVRSVRHQMPGGALCLIEPDPFRRTGEIVRAVDVLRRAERWFFAIDNGRNPYDSPEADVQAHMSKAADILIGPEFYDVGLRVGGLFHAAFAWSHQGKARFVGISISSDFSTPAGYRDSRGSLARVFPWVREEIWDAAGGLGGGGSRFKDLLEGDVVIRGVWWDLTQEPPPIRDGRELLGIARQAGLGSTLDSALSEIAADLRDKPFAYFGLRFPDRNGGLDWLFVRVGLGDDRFRLLPSLGDRVSLVERGRVSAIYRHSLRLESLTLRNRGRVSEAISSTTFSLLGSGALGSCVGDLLAKAGAKSVMICDKDLMEPANSIRHMVGIESFALLKATATALAIIQHNPFCELKTFDADILQSFEAIELAMTGADLIVSTTADESVETAVNEVAVRMGKTVYYARALRGGASGRIFRVVPGRDACRFCVAWFVKEAGELGAWLDVQEDEDTVIGHECGSPIIASSGADLSLIGSLTARLVLDDIKNGFGDSNHWLWTTESLPGHAALREPYRLVPRIVPRHDGCPVCSDPPVRKIHILVSVKTMMDKVAISAGGNEVCGILVGSLGGDGIVEVVAASDVGPNARGTANGCWRDVEYVQAWLDKRLRGDTSLRYVGEWHSHPTADTRPSRVDVESLMGIASSENYACPGPVMMILGGGAGGNLATSAYSFAVGRPYREIDWEAIDARGDGAP